METIAFVDQRTDDDCYTACIASLTGLPLAEFPVAPAERSRATEAGYLTAIQRFLRERGWMLLTTWLAAPKGYAIATGPSVRRPGIAHCVIALEGKTVHDPHPSRAGIPSVEEYEILVEFVQAQGSGVC